MDLAITYSSIVKPARVYKLHAKDIIRNSPQTSIEQTIISIEVSEFESRKDKVSKEV
jgi:hypothetical protein